MDLRDTMRQIDRSSPIPLYYQLQEILKQEIDNERWKPGELLPSEAEMNAMFGVSRTVIRQALDVLEGDGQVYRVKGKGTIVAEPKFRYEAVGAAVAWGRTNEASPRVCSVISEQWVPVGGHVGRLLEVHASETVLELTFVQCSQRTPASLTQMFLRAEATPALARVELPLLSKGGPEALVQLHDRFDLRIGESKVSIEATRANRFEAECLDISEATPVFLVGSLEVGEDGRPVAFSRTVVRSDQFRFDVVIRYSEAGEGMTHGYSPLDR